MGDTPEEDKPLHKLSSENRREREFYRYFEPIQAWTPNGPTCCDLGDNESISNHVPVPSPDSALTAFCQLGALRVRTRRAMLFLFDRSHAYILAEATQTLSLLDDSVQNLDDGVWLGHAKIPRGHSICEHTTLHLEPSHDHDGPTGDDSLVHIINDLREDTNFCASPFVKHGLKARFYAGVPIRTKRGVNIGTYCLLDEKPRVGLEESELKFLRHISSTIMSHLEMVRAKFQHERATRMVAGIGSFVDGASDLGRGENEESSNTLTGRARKSHSRHQSGRTGSVIDANTPSTSRPPESRKQSNESAKIPENGQLSRNLQMGSPSQSSPGDAAASLDSVQVAQTGADNAHMEPGVTKRADDLKAELVSSNVRHTFERAAAVLRDAVGVDGALFLDASQSSYGGLVGSLSNTSSQGHQSEHNSDASLSSTDEAKGEKERGQHHESANEEKQSTYCGVLATSYSRNDDRSQLPEVGGQINEKFLKKLLRRYPKGKIWNFSAQGISSSDDDSRCESSVPPANLAQGLLSRKKDRKHSRIEDGKRIALHFPGVRSLAVAGMWNQASGRWQAASVLWTYRESRYLTEDLDMPFLQAFSDVIMAEIHRIEAQRSDRAKVDFISSISHELRSPLHGILGSAEVIQEQGTDDLTTELVSQIEACGRTLLDIVDNLLDFSKINYYGRTKRNPQSDSNNRQDQLSSAGTSSQLGSMMSLDTELSLDLITEEVVDSAFYSFCCSQERRQILERKVAIVMDIERGSDVNWFCRIALGGWKRIIINLVSNALKYTTEGYIHITLIRQPGKKKRKYNALLTVKDSGHGMSNAFLRDRLFSAFAQEDSFADGTGLGMNLVSTIVKAIGGKIEVHSEPDKGTSVVVQVPLEEASAQDSATDASGHQAEPALPSGLVIAISSGDAVSRMPDLSPIQATSQAILLGSVVKTCDELGGVRTMSLVDSNLHYADVFLISEAQISQFYLNTTQEESGSGSGSAENNLSGLAQLDTPLIVLCHNEIGLRELRASHPESLTGRHVELIRQPVGPERISKAIRGCLSAKANKQLDESSGGLAEATAYDSGDRSTKRQDSRLRTDAHSTKPREVQQQAVPLQSVDMTPQVFPRSDSRTGAKSHEHLSGGARRALHPLTQQMSASDDASTSQNRTYAGKKPQRPVLNRAESGLTLLLVDDNAINLQLLTTYANKHGHLNIRAHNGQHAVDAYKAACTGTPLPPQIAAIQTSSDERIVRTPKRPRVVLMDINMPVLNGYEATQHIREFEQSHGLPSTTVVALTGLGSADAQQEAYSSGVDLFLTKPVKLKELSKILDGIEREE